MSARLTRRLAGWALAFAAAAAGPAAAQTATAVVDELWQRLATGGYVLLIRHAATVEGFGDPPGYRLDDCATQRNLSDDGRQEARRLGEAFRQHRIPVGEVRSSPWCRCVETARLAFGRSAVWPALGSLFDDRSGEDQQRREILAYTRGYDGGGNLVLVTHNVNIRSLVGVSPRQAEVIVARPGGKHLQLVGRIPPP